MTAISLARPHLLLVVELEPYRYATAKREPPAAKRSAPHAALWQRYWQECLADSGLYELTPTSPASWHVSVAELETHGAIPQVVLNELQGAGLPGFPDDDGGIAAQIDDAVLPLCGGYALLDGPELVIEPTCCGDLGSLYEWRAGVARESSDWQDLWTGHPPLELRAHERTIEVRHRHEPGQPEAAHVFVMQKPALAAAVAAAVAQQERLQARIQASLRAAPELDWMSDEEVEHAALRMAGMR